MQESLHLQITKLIVRQDQPMQMKSLKKTKKTTTNESALYTSTRHTVHAGLLCYALYVSGFHVG